MKKLLVFITTFITIFTVTKNKEISEISFLDQF